MALSIGLLPYAATASTVVDGMLFQFTITAFAAWINLYFVFVLVVPATLVGRLTFTELLTRASALVIGIALNLEFLSLTLLNRELFTWGFGQGLMHVNQAIGGVVGIVSLHASYWLAARQALSFRGPKRPSRGFYQRLLWAGGIGGIALATFLTTSGRLVITLIAGAAGPDDTPGVLLSTMVVFAAIAGICVIYWARYNRSWNLSRGSVERSSPQFVEEEWEARHELQLEGKTPFIVAALGYSLGFVVGLFVIISIAIEVRQDPIAVGLAWMFAFPIIAIVNRRNARKTAVETAARLVAV
jgi:hypothetical protein